MAKPNFILPNKPAIKAGSILSYNYTDDLKFAAEPLDFSRNSSATRVNEQGLIEEVGYFGPQLIQNGDFSQEGSEEVTNGDFSVSGTPDATSWALGWYSNTNNAEIANGKLTLSNSATESVSRAYATNGVDSNNILTTNKFYKLQYDIVENNGATDLKYYSANAEFISVPSVDVGSYTLYIQNTGNSLFLFQLNTSNASISLDNVSIKEVGQDWILGAGWSIGDNKAINDGTINAIYTQKAIQQGKKYVCKVDITFQGAGVAYWRLGNTTNLGVMSVDGTITQTLTGSANGNYIGIFANTAITIANVSVIEVIGDKPRIDYSDSSTEPSLLLEPQSTNLITYSEDFSNSSWNAVTDVIVDEGYLSPEGTLNAAKVTKDGTNAKLAMFIGGTAPITKSIYARTVSGTGTAYFGEGSVSGGVLSTVTEQWQRFEITVNGNNFYAVDFRGAATLTEVIIFGAQFEQQSYATSYIPTSGSTATRLGETANNAGGAGVFNSEEGVLYAEIAALADDLSQRYISLSDGTAGERVVLLYHNSTNRIRCFIKSGGSFYATLDKVVSNEKDFHKIAYKYKSGESKLFVDGSLAATSTDTFSVTGLDVLQFANGIPTADPFYGKIKNLKVFNYALTDEELQTLTT